MTTAEVVTAVMHSNPSVCSFEQADTSRNISAVSSIRVLVIIISVASHCCFSCCWICQKVRWKGWVSE